MLFAPSAYGVSLRRHADNIYALFSASISLLVYQTITNLSIVPSDSDEEEMFRKIRGRSL
jgi:hypothetical protein